MTTQTMDPINPEQDNVTPAPAPAPVATPDMFDEHGNPVQGQQSTGNTEGQDGQPARKPNGVQRRIDELTRKSYENEREAQYWKQIAQGKSGTTPASAPAPAADTKPTPDKFADYADYLEALTDWKADQKVSEALSKRDQDAQQKQELTQHQTRVKTWVERQAAVREALPDYDEVMGDADVAVSPHVQEILLDSDMGPQMAYHLAKNQDEAERISSLSPLAAARELGKLEAALASKSPQASTTANSQAPAPAAPKVTKAPTPITPVRGTGGQFTKAPESMSDAEWYASRRPKA